MIITDIIHVVSNLVSFEKPFTAFNVTLKLQEMGHDVKHSQVRNLIVASIEDIVGTNYIVTEIINPKTSRTARLYHPYQYDPTDFEFSPNPNVTLPHISISRSLYDNRGRLTVPVSYVRGASLRPGDLVSVHNRGGHLEIEKTSPGHDPCYTVEKSGIIRISESRIFDVFQHFPQSLFFQSANNKIYIEENTP